MRYFVLAIAFAVSLLPAPRVEAQETDADSSLTALPWQGVSLRISAEERVGSIAGNVQLPGSPVRLRFGASAPLDEDTRRAAFIEPSGDAAAFRANIYVGYESWLNTINTINSQEAALRACRRLTGRGERLDCNGTPEQIQSRLLAATDSTVPALSRGVDWALGFQVTGAYDRQAAVPAADIAADATEYNKYEVAFRGRFALYTEGRFALQLRVGLDIDRQLDLSSVERCRAANSDDASVTGRSCGQVNVLREASGTEARLAADLALTLLAPFTIGDDVRPGFEVAIAIEDGDIVDDATSSRFVTRMVLFTSPRVASALLRFGVGAQWSTFLHDDPNGSYSGGDTRFTPYVVVGGSLQP